MKFIDLDNQRKSIETKILKNITKVVKSGKYINGQHVKKFEKVSSAFIGYRFCSGLSSGTDALLASMMALNVNAKTKVFIPGFTYTATAEVICLLGARPIFVDVNDDDFLISLVSLETALKKYSKPGDIILPVDLFGVACDYKKIIKLKKKYNCKVIIDGAQSFGQKKVHNIDFYCTSFFPSKSLGCYGDGGAVYSDNKILIDKVRSIKNHGMGKNKYDIKLIGLNARLDEIQAAILIEKLKIFKKELNKKRQLLKQYIQNLKCLVPQKFKNINEHSCSQAVFKTRNNKKLKNFLDKNHIPSMIYYPKTIADQSAYKMNGIICDKLNVAKSLTKKVIALPFHSYLTSREISKIIKFVNLFHEK